MCVEVRVCAYECVYVSFIGVVNLAAGVVFISIFASCLANGADVTVTTTHTHTQQYTHRCRESMHAHIGHLTLFIQCGMCVYNLI